MPPRKRYRCRYCGHTLPAWLPRAKRPNGAMLLYHLSQHHPDQVGPYLEQWSMLKKRDEVTRGADSSVHVQEALAQWLAEEA